MRLGFALLPISVCVLFLQLVGCARHSNHFTIDLDISPDELPYRWETLEEWKSEDQAHLWHQLLDDLDGDGSSERVLWYNDISSPGRVMSALVYYEDPVKGKVRWQDNSNTGCEIKNISFFDLNGDGKKEIFVSKVKGDSIFFRVTDLEMNLIREFLADVGKGLDPMKGWILNIWTLGVWDLNEDGYSELIYTIDAKPDSSVQRAVVGYDVRAGKELWRYLIAGHVTPLTFHAAPSPDPGADLLIFCINSYANRYAANGMDDLHSYVVALDFQGKELWRHVVGAAFSMPRLVFEDINHDGREEVLVGQSSYASTATDSFQILCYDATTGDLEAASPKFAESTRDLEFYRGDDPSQNTVIACLDPGRLVKLSAQLEVLQEGDPVNIGEIYRCDHLLGHQIPVWLCYTKNNKVAAFDNRWGLLAIYEGASLEDYRYSILKTENKRGILVRTESGLALISLFKRNPSAVFFAKYKWWLILAVAIGAAYSLNIGARKLWNLYLSASGLPSLDKLQVGVMVLDQKGRVLFSNSNPVIHELTGGKRSFRKNYRDLFTGEASPAKEAIQSSYENHLLPYEGEVEVKLKEREKRYYISIFPRIDQDNRFKGKVVTIDDVTDRPSWKKTVVLGEAAQKWIHHLKGNLATAKLAVENLQQSPYYTSIHDRDSLDTYLRDIQAELAESSQTSTKILRFLRMGKPDLIPCDINVVIEKALSRYHSYRPRGIEIETELRPDLPLISGDPVQLAEAFDNLLSNAMEAMENGGTLAVSTHLASKLHERKYQGEKKGDEFLRIDIKDAGRGIHQRDMERIFEPGFSKSKSGTGIGLAIVKEVVIKHKGRITVKSKLGEGSTFSVLLPITKSEV